MVTKLVSLPNENKNMKLEGVKWNVACKGVPNPLLSKKDQKWNLQKSKIRAKGEHPFGLIKHLLRICQSQISRDRQKRLPTVFPLCSR